MLTTCRWQFWGSEIADKPPTVNYAEVMASNSNQGLAKLLDAIVRSIVEHLFLGVTWKANPPPRHDMGSFLSTTHRLMMPFIPRRSWNVLVPSGKPITVASMTLFLTWPKLTLHIPTLPYLPIPTQHTSQIPLVCRPSISCRTRHLPMHQRVKRRQEDSHSSSMATAPPQFSGLSTHGRSVPSGGLRCPGTPVETKALQ